MENRREPRTSGSTWGANFEEAELEENRQTDRTGTLSKGPCSSEKSCYHAMSDRGVGGRRNTLGLEGRANRDNGEESRRKARSVDKEQVKKPEESPEGAKRRREKGVE